MIRLDHVDYISLYDLYSKGISNLAVKRVWYVENPERP
jgi:hypothetical protein